MLDTVVFCHNFLKYKHYPSVVRRVLAVGNALCLGLRGQQTVGSSRHWLGVQYCTLRIFECSELAGFSGIAADAVFLT